MRFLPCLLFLTLIAGCASGTAYTDLDLRQVREAYGTITPLYVAYKAAYQKNDPVAIRRDFQREQHTCKLADRIDRRDTIDPNVNLYLVSVSLDDFCNAIETSYAYWAKHHGYPYDKTVVAERGVDAFIGSDKDLALIDKEMRHPQGEA